MREDQQQPQQQRVSTAGIDLVPLPPLDVQLSRLSLDGKPSTSEPAATGWEQAPVNTSGLVVVHVRPGSEYQALHYLLRHVNRHFGKDDLLPDPPDEIADYRYKVLAWPKDADPAGDASTSFLTPTYPGGLLLKHVRVRPREAWEIRPEHDMVRQQRLMPLQLKAGQLKAIRRQVTSRPPIRCFDKVELLPVAMPSDPRYLEMAGDAICKFNALGLVLTVYLEETCSSVAAALRVQAAWRCAMLRRGALPLHQQIKNWRAAVVIQKAWRAFLFKRRFVLLRDIKKLSNCMKNLLLGGRMTMDVWGSQLLRHRTSFSKRLYPEHALRFAFDRFRKVHIVVPEGQLRGGLPLWLGVAVSTMSAAEFQEAHGDQPIYGQQDAMQLLLNGAEWQEPNGTPRAVTDGLPEPPLNPQPTQCILQIHYVDIVEARSRACLMLALTFDPKFCQGTALVPPHLSSLGRFSSMDTNASATASQMLEMHRWSSLKATFAASSQPSSPLATPSRYAAGSPPRGERGGAAGAPPSRLGTPQLLSLSGSGGGCGSAAGSRQPSPQRGSSRQGSPFILLRDGSPERMQRSISSGGGARNGSVTASPHGGAASPAAGSQPTSPVRRSGPPSPGAASVLSSRPDTGIMPYPDSRTGSRGGVGSGGGGAEVLTIQTDEGSLNLGSAPPSPTRALSPGRGGLLSPQSPRRPGAPRSPIRSPSPLRLSSSRLASPQKTAAEAAELGLLQGPGQDYQRQSLQGQQPGQQPQQAQQGQQGQQGQGLEAGGSGGGSTPRLPPLPGQSGPRPSSQGERPVPRMGSPSRMQPRPLTQPGSGDPGAAVYGKRQSQEGTLQLPPIGSGRLSQQGGLSTSGQQQQGPVARRSGPGDAGQDPQAGPWASYELENRGSGRLATPEGVSGGLPSASGSRQRDYAEAAGARLGSSQVASVAPAFLRQDSAAASSSTAGWPSTAATGHAARTPPLPPGGLLSPLRPLATPLPTAPAPVSVSRTTPTPGSASVAPHLSHPPHRPSSSGSSNAYSPRAPTDGGWEPFGPLQQTDGTLQSSTWLPDGKGKAADGLDGEGWGRGGGRTRTPTPPPATPTSRLMHAIKKAEAYANDPSHMVLLPQGTHLPLQPGPGYGAEEWAVLLQEERDLLRWLGENPELHVEQARLLPFMRERELLNASSTQASLVRYQSHLHDAFIHAQRAEQQYERAARSHGASTRTVFANKPTDTGHRLAPGYTPLSASEMGDLVAAMAEVYRVAAAEASSKARQDHSEVMREIREEKEHLQQVISVAHHRQSEVAATMRALYTDAWDKAKRARVSQRMVRAARKQRQAHDRSFAQAFMRQTNLLAKNVQDGEQAALSGYHAALRKDATTAQRRENAQTHANIGLARQDLVEHNRWKAVEVKKSGYTREMQQYAEATEQYNKNVVSLRKLDEVERLQRVGPAGAPGKPAASLRAPLPLSTVVSAADAKQQRQRQRQRAAAAAAAAAAKRERAQPAAQASTAGGASAADGDDAALAAGSAWPAEQEQEEEEEEAGMEVDGEEGEEEEDEDDTLPDYLPEFPYARGATLTISQTNKPTGIIV